jgi:hypothetical protein
VLAVAESTRDVAVELNEAVDGFGAAVGCSARVEVGQERRAPLLQRAAESLDLRDGAGRQDDKEPLGDPAALDRVLRLVGGSQLLRTEPGDETSSWRSSAAMALSSRARCRSVRFSLPQRKMVWIP